MNRATPPNSPLGTGQVDDFITRLEQYLDDAMSPAQIQAFSDELAVNAEKQRLFVTFAVQHRHLRDHGRSESQSHEIEQLVVGGRPELIEPTQDDVFADVIAAALHSREEAERLEHASREQASNETAAPIRAGALQGEQSKGARIIVIPQSLAYGAIAAIIILGVWVAYSLFSDGNTKVPPQQVVEEAPNVEPEPELPPVVPVEPEVVAEVRAMVDATELTGTNPVGQQGLYPGEYGFESGLIQLELQHGVQVVLQGPCRFELRSDNGMRLIRGQLVAKITPNAWGFIVDTPSARIVDIGTEFGVSCDEQGSTQVHVFDGEVRAAARDDAGQTLGATPVLANQAAKIVPGRSDIQAIEFSEAKFERQAVKRLDLVDIICGGIGTTNRKGVGINPTTGRYVQTISSAADMVARNSTGQAFGVESNALLSRVFVPPTDGVLKGLPDDLQLPALPRTNGVGFGVIWCDKSMPSLRAGVFSDIPSKIGNYDFEKSDRQTMIVHANVGMVLDLDAVRRAHPGYRITRASMIVGNSSGHVLAGDPTDYLSEFLIYVDSKPASRSRFQRSNPIEQHAVEVNIDLPEDASYLTLVSADAGDGNHRDWLVVAQPVLILEPVSLPLSKPEP